MKHVLKLRLHGWKRISNGWTKPIGLAAVCCAVGLALSLNSATAAQSTPITQLEYLQWLVQACGDSSQFAPGAGANDLAQWGTLKGLNPNGGWQANAKLTREALAQTLVQLFGLNPRKNGGNYELTLKREGINLPAGAIITRTDLVSLVDDVGFRSRTALIAKCSTSPTHGNNGVGNGQDAPPPGWMNPRNPHYGQPQNDGPGTGPGNPGNKGGGKP